MKIVWLLLCIAFAGCGPKSNEEIAKDLITEKLKTTLPDFKDYESVNFGALGSASLPYEETDQYVANSKAIKDCNDSIASLEILIKENKTASSAGSYNSRLQELKDSIRAKGERNATGKQSYTPEKLFKMSHAYTLKDKAGLDKKIEEEFYMDKDLKKVLKVRRVY